MSGDSKKRALSLVAASLAGGMLLAACGHGQAPAHDGSHPVHKPVADETVPRGVMSAAQACRLIVEHEPRGFFTHIKRVHLVLTTYAKGEPVESAGDISTAMPPHTLVWVVDVHAKKVNWDHSVPPGARIVPGTEFSVVMNAKTGYVSDAGEGNGWPLPLEKLGPIVSLTAEC